MGTACSRPAVLDDYQPTWQRQRVHEDTASTQAAPTFGGEDLLLPIKRQPLNLAPALGGPQNLAPALGAANLNYNVTEMNGSNPPEGRNMQVEEVEQPMPASMPSTASLPRGPVMLPVDEPIQWIRGDLIGAGAFGRVYAGLDESTGQLMAVKQVLLCKDNSLVGRVNEQVVSLEKEVAVLKQLNHPNIVRYLGTERTDECLNIFLEFVPGGSIASLINRFGSLKESVLKIYTRQILTGLEYLHQHQIMHRDIKGANILVDNTGLIKLADFGASKKIEDLVTLESNGAALSIKGTPYWMAPEVIKQSGHGRSADIWSVACTIIEMATGKPPWSQFSSQVSALFHIASSKGPPPIPEHLSKEAQDFLLLCFNRIPKERPNATRLLRHPWLANAPPRTLATPLTNISMDSGPLGFQAPNLIIPPTLIPAQCIGAGPISPIQEESETPASLDLKPPPPESAPAPQHLPPAPPNNATFSPSRNTFQGTTDSARGTSTPSSRDTRGTASGSSRDTRGTATPSSKDAAPGQMPGHLPGQLPGQQIPGQMPGQLPGQMLGQQIPGQLPGPLPGHQIPGQLSGQLVGTGAGLWAVSRQQMGPPLVVEEGEPGSARSSLAVDSPEPVARRSRRAWDAPTFGFGLHPVAVTSPQRAQAGESYETRNNGGQGRQSLPGAAGEPDDAKAWLSSSQNKGSVIYIHATTAIDGPRASSAERDSAGVTDFVIGADSPHSSMESGSYNPVEEPSWMQSTPFDLSDIQSSGNFAGSPSRECNSPHLRDEGDVRCSGPSTATPDKKNLDPGSPGLDYCTHVHPGDRGTHVHPGDRGADEAELQAYVQKKANRDILRLSMPFKDQSLQAMLSGGDNHLNKQAQWEAELARELAEQRTILSARRQ